MPSPTARPTTDQGESLGASPALHGDAGEPSAIALTALSVGRRRLPGPGLATTAPPTVLVSAVDRRGVPVTGLQRGAFAVQTITADADRQFGARDATIDAFGEVAPGIYALETQESAMATAPYALVVTVSSPRANVQGRAVVRIDAQ